MELKQYQAGLCKIFEQAIGKATVASRTGRKKI